MAKYSIIPIDTLRQLLECDFESGKLTWKSRPEAVFADGIRHSREHIAKFWNKKFMGKEAFTSQNKGYFVGTIFNKHYSAHRVVWALYYGRWPDRLIDHVNGLPSDNRIQNLRVVSDSQNSQNMKRHKDNASGYTGVYFIKATGKWRSEIMCRGKRINLGFFFSKEEAACARKQGEIKHGFHPNHGR